LEEITSDFKEGPHYYETKSQETKGCHTYILQRIVAIDLARKLNPDLKEMNCLPKCGDLEVPPRPPLEGAEGGMSSEIKGKKQCISYVLKIN
jgi:hypothetical protein